MFERVSMSGALALDKTIAMYQHTGRYILGNRCRFYPSCSSYARQCLRQLPLRAALKKIIWRLWRCQPFYPGGVDLP